MVKMLPLYVLSGILGIAVIYSGLTGHRLMFITNTRTAVIALTFIGFLMCSLGSLGIFIAKAPLNPLSIAGYILGVFALFTGSVQLFRMNIPYLNEPSNALIIIAIIIVIKFIIARLGHLVFS